MGNWKRLAFTLSILILVAFPKPVFAQDQPGGPTYIIQAGDTLGVVATKFGVSVEDIISTNNIKDPNVLAAGQAIIIPGLIGITGNLTAETIPVGANINSLSVQYQFPLVQLAKLNKLTSPLEIYAGSSLILPQSDVVSLNARDIVKPGETILEASIRANSNPWIVTLQNNLTQTWQGIPSQPVFYTQNSGNQTASNSPIPFLNSLTIDKLPLIQGNTIEISAVGEPGLEITGNLAGNNLHFFQNQAGQYIALQGIYSMAQPGLTQFSLSIKKPESSQFEFSQMVYLQSGNYPEDPPLTVDPSTIDPANTKPEEDKIRQITSVITPEKLWQGKFRDPVDEPVCFKSRFGVRRSYNEGSLNSFHAGLDYGVCAPSHNIYAPAAGTVVFTGALTVRGNATIIDHGQGIYSGYWHQEEISAKVGDHVEPGQLIGKIGDTGRVTGPHLHWEIWVNGVQVDPIPWLERIYP
jgi:murein DD-endopeptidase MepM/ murein hydrolase activator NlpD